MKSILKFVLFVGILGGLGYMAYAYGKEYLPLRRERDFRTVEATRGRLVSVVTATGTIRPVVTVQVGSFVSGQVQEIFVDFNDVVEKDQLLARIDPRTYESHVARDKATLATAQADLSRAQVMLDQAKSDEARALAVKSDNADYISDIELDKFKYQRLTAETQVEVAQAAVKQAQAMLENSEANLAYTEIRAPVSGVVIDRSIEPGQTLASSFQVPRLFEIAQDMDQAMNIMASVDEADIGTIIKASEEDRIVRFTVDAYPDVTFTGKIIQIRSSSNSRESIVTYPVIVEAENKDSRLLPGMTANLEFETNVLEDVLRVPNTAMRFLPDREQVVPESRNILDRQSSSSIHNTLAAEARQVESPSDDVAERVLWVQDKNFVRPVHVKIGVSNPSFTEILGGDVKEGDRFVDAVLTDR